MISFSNETFTNAAPLDLFNGASSDGKWVVHIEFGSFQGPIYLSPDGTTQGQKLQAPTGRMYRFVVEDQDLYLKGSSAANSHVYVTVLPLVEGNVSLGLCSC